MQPPPAMRPMMRLPADPTFDEIREAGGKVDLHSEPHTVSDDHVWVSGEIERTTEHETGLIGSIQYIDGKWKPDEV